MPKVLCMTGMVIAILILVLFLADLALRIPFNRISVFMDVSFVICATGLGYLSFSAFRDLD